MSKSTAYTASEIEVLESLDAVRMRPGMYIGSTSSKGLHHLIWELVDNAIDEHLAGYGSRIRVVIHRDGSVSVSDEGRGIPTDIHPKVGKPAAEVVLTMLHAGGKFGGGGYSISGGLHGVGVSVVNALSTHLIVDIYRDGKHFHQEFSKGKPTMPLTVIGESKKTGTTIRFYPDPSIFDDTDWHRDVIVSRLREYALLNANLTIELVDERAASDNTWTFSYRGGLIKFVQLLNEQQKPIHENIFFVDETVDNVRVMVAFQYNDEYNERILSFANNIKTVDGGYHETGFKAALTRCLNAYGKSANLLRSTMTLTGQDIREGLTAVISVYLPDPQFEGQTKGKLGNSYIRSIVENVVSNRLSVWLDINREDAVAIVKKSIEAAEVREHTKRVREIVRKGQSGTTSTLPGKLADCRSRKPHECELFLVEGDSAGGTAKQARDRETQAILPLKGKILNVERARLDKILKNREIASIIQALGCGIGDDFDLEKLRYHKIIILVDADVDGAHIATLLLTFFYRYMPDLIKHGHIYFAQPPLYSVTVGKEKHYLANDQELQAFLKKKKVKNPIIQRFKGLGEMHPDQLWETTMNPKTRRLLAVEVVSDVDAERVTLALMSSDPTERRKLIESYDPSSVALDI